MESAYFISEYEHCCTLSHIYPWSQAIQIFDSPINLDRSYAAQAKRPLLVEWNVNDGRSPAQTKIGEIERDGAM